MANRRPPWHIPDVINPPKRRCIQIEIPDDQQHISIFWGVLRSLSDWQRWERDEEKRGTLVAQVWREVVYAIDWSNMSCCPKPTNQRYNENGELEVSYDGGLTWDVDHTIDDRFSGIVAPALAGADSSEKRCIGATSAQAYVEANLIDDLTEGETYAEINAALVAIAAVLGLTGIGLLLAAAAAAIFLAGVAAVQAAFTSEVWADFRCILYCNSNNDASFTPAQWENVKAQILVKFSGVVSAILYNWVNGVGPVGLTNSARSGFAASGDCSLCECEDCEFLVTFDGLNWTEFTTEYGSIVSGQMNVVSHEFPLGAGHGTQFLIDLAQNCTVNKIECDFMGVNQRPGNSIDITATFYDDEMTSLGSQGFSSSFTADGVEHHGSSPVTDIVCRFVQVFYGWIDVGEPNSGWIDNIHINAPEE